MIEEIYKAMDAHSMWRERLAKAIDDKHIEIPVETIKVDNQCAFGKWIYGGDIPEDIKSSEIFHNIISVHAEFHKEAAKIAELAINHKEEEAKELMKVDSRYDQLSKNLYQLLFQLKKQAKS